jgi:hypothetical protein
VTLKDDLKAFSITEEDRKRLTPEQIARLEALVNELRANEPPSVTLHNPDKFDAKDMHPVGKGPVNWKKPRR